MKERRTSGATHSFRLTIEAAEIVDQINHPRRLGGKSRKISEAIEWYFTPVDAQESLEEIFASRKFWKERHDKLLDDHIKEKASTRNRKKMPSTPTWRRRFLTWIL